MWKRVEKYVGRLWKGVKSTLAVTTHVLCMIQSYLGVTNVKDSMQKQAGVL